MRCRIRPSPSAPRAAHWCGRKERAGTSVVLAWPIHAGTMPSTSTTGRGGMVSASSASQTRDLVTGAAMPTSSLHVVHATSAAVQLRGARAAEATVASAARVPPSHPGKKPSMMPATSAGASSSGIATWPPPRIKLTKHSGRPKCLVAGPSRPA
jgi:hypothetical protein